MNCTRSAGFFIVFFGALLLISSCDGSGSHKDLKQYIENLRQEVITKDKVIAETSKPQVPPTVVKYESGTRRSPFEVLELAPAKDRVISNPLQAYPLDMLRFVGTVTQNGSTIAFVSAPDNKIYQIKAGDILGDRDSQVVTIESDRINLMEEYSVNGSAAMKRVVTLQLKEASQ